MKRSITIFLTQRNTRLTERQRERIMLAGRSSLPEPERLGLPE